MTVAVTVMSGALLLQTEVGRVALVDRWERTALAFGRDVDDARYARLNELSTNGPAYALITGLLQGPVLVFGLAALIYGSGAFGSRLWPLGPKAERRQPNADRRSYRQVLAVVSHAGVILAFRDAVGAPLNYVRETLASPTTLTMFFPMFDEASPVARFFGLIDLFVLWWAVVLAIGASVLYRRRMSTLVAAFIGTYIGVALLLALVMALSGGTTG